MLEMFVPVRAKYFEVAVVDKQLITGRNINVITVKGNASQTTIGATPFPINVVRIPVDVLGTLLGFEIDREYAAMAFALLASSDNGCCYELGKLDSHLQSVLQAVPKYAEINECIAQ